MKGSDILDSFPEAPGAAREKAILAAVENGDFVPFDWEPVEATHNGHKATLYVTGDCLRLGDAEDSVRVSLSAITAQAIADVFAAFLPTTKICDLVWKQARVHLEPCLFGEPRSTTSRMRDYHEAVEKAVAGRKGLIENVGKHWVLTNKLLSTPGRAANYGFFSPAATHVTASGIRAWQPLGLAHNGAHADYSQVLRLVGDKLVVDGKTMLFKDVATDPTLCGLVSSEGILRTLRASPQPAAAPKPAPVVTPKALKAVALPLQLGSKGEDVRLWQAFLGVGIDGGFGPVTAGATELFRQREGLPRGKSVDAMVIEAAVDLLESDDDALTLPFVEARNYTKASRRPKDLCWIVLHTMEAAEKGTTAEACAEYFRTTTRQASAHYCIAPSTRVLTGDLRWVPAATLVEGQQVVAVDEFSRKTRGRRYQMAHVQKTARRIASCVAITLEDGRRLTCSTDHWWLAQLCNGGKWEWVAADALRTGDVLSAPLTPWSEGSDEGLVWLGGLFDGEGCLHRQSFELTFSQCEGPVMDRALEVLAAASLPHRVHWRSPKQVSHKKIGIVHLSGVQGNLELLARARPRRFVDRVEELLRGRFLGSRSYNGRVGIAAIEATEDQEVISLRTSSRTFLAEGIVSHNCIDNDSIVQSVSINDIAWCAPGANRDGIHLEHAGFAKQSPAEWADEYSLAMLGKSAALAARLAKDAGIPVQYIDAAKLQAARKLQDAGKPVPPELKGITTHHQVSQAFKRSTHYDPGPGFPMESYLAMVRRAS